ncbi:MAG: hypothetical protein WBA17_09000 [Saprospiraceae bacterium]
MIKIFINWIIYLIYRTRQISHLPYLLYGYGESNRDNYGAGLAGFIIWLMLASIVTAANGYERISQNALILSSILVVGSVVIISSTSIIESKMEKFKPIDKVRKGIYGFSWAVIFIASLTVIVKVYIW